VSLQPGARLGLYEIVAPLGAGGMGEVYRARDTKLNRDVALKLLPDLFAADADRLARFQREAQVLASLNHPHIAQIYGLEDSSPSTGSGQAAIRAIVMELVEGATLADRIAYVGRALSGPPTSPDLIRSGLQVDEALSIARQIAEALEAAHDKGVIHRDLKPANVMITHGGLVKVLDFGLAAVAQGSGPDIGVTNSPTLTMAATRAGVILGTAGYMSPEQAAGKPVDKRADIWSFGVILWEMLAGQRLFDGETVSHTLADVLRAEIDFNTLPSDTPPVIRDLLRRCLDRDVRNRLRDIGEARVTIQKYLPNPAANVTVAAPAGAAGRSSWLTSVAWSVAVVAAASAGALAFVHFRERPPAAESVRFQILPPEQTAFTTTAVLAPDGKRLVFDAPGPDGRAVLWVRSLDSLDARPLPGTEGASPGPFWSPDSRFLAFGVNGFPGRLKKVEASGGPPQTLCEYTGGFREGAWNTGGVIVFGAGPNGLARVPDAGGAPSLVTKIDPSRAEVQHAGPTFLADGLHFLYHRESRARENRGIYLGSIDARPDAQSATRLLAADSDPVYVPSSGAGGSLLFLREGALMAQSFDGRSTLTSDAIPVAEDVGNLGSYGWFSASATGALAFRTGRGAAATSALLWLDRQGKRLDQVGPPADYREVQLSPDGKRVVATRMEGVGGVASAGSLLNTRVWIAELTRGIFSRLNSGGGNEASPAFSPDGRVAYSTNFTLNGAVGDLYRVPADGVGSPEPLLVKSGTIKHPNDVSPDGRFLIYDDHTAQRQDLWILPLDTPPGTERKPVPFVVTPADETFGQFSPDGKWIAYSSDESGRREVYVQGFDPTRSPAVAVGKWQISTAGGDKPRWAKNGKELYYLAPDRKMMAVSVKLGSTFEPGVAVPLFDTKAVGFFPYDVSADGRFLVNTVSDVAASTSTPVTIVLNWQAGLKR
jgi:Tol biopolymer transport system component